MAEPLILVPGVASDAQIWEGMPDGAVAMSDAGTIKGMARDILAGAPPRFALAGHSMGGYIALAMMAQAPDRIARLALISTSAASDTPEQRAGRLQTMASAKADFEAVIQTLSRAMLSRESRADERIVDEVAAMIRRCGLAAFLRQQQAVLGRDDYRHMLAEIDVPVLIITGEDDRVVAPARSVELAEGITGARLLSIPHCGHLPQREASMQVRAAMTEWLDGQGNQA